MNRLNNKLYGLYGITTNSYGEQIKGELVANIYCNLVETKTDLSDDKATSALADYLAITNYKEAKVGQFLDDYIITSVINSTRFAQLGLKKL